MQLPDFTDAFCHENNFYLSCASSRMSKILCHYELYKRSLGLPGSLVECGILKGASFVRWAMFRDLFEHAEVRKIIGFDIFGPFPDTQSSYDQDRINLWHTQGEDNFITRAQLLQALAHKGITRGIELVEGDIRKTIPEYVKKKPSLRISLLNLDTDTYESTTVILEHLYPLVVPGGIVLLDDYAAFEGESKAVEEYFAGQAVRIEKLPFALSPSFIRKPCS